MWRKTALCGLALIMIAACAPPPEAEQTSAAAPVESGAETTPGKLQPGAVGQVRGTPWRLEDLDKSGIIDRSRITLLLGEDGRASGMAGCNRYSAAYTLSGTALTIDARIASTRMACAAEALMQQEQRYFELLPLMHEASIDATGALILTGKDGASMKFYPDEDVGQSP